MERTKHKNLVLILARELASNVALPMFLADPDGTLIFYNEPAEKVLGQTFAQTGELAAGEWGALWHPTTVGGEPIASEALPLSVALAEHRPAHDVMRINALDGSIRQISITALPLFSSTDEFVGAVAMFWEEKRAD